MGIDRRTIAPDEERIRADWEQLSRFRAEGLPGWTRRPFTPAYRDARAWLDGRMQAAGLATEIDAAGNLIGRRPGRPTGRRPIVIGSHIDTVAGGGRFDGMIGVLGAIELQRCLPSDVLLEHPLEIVDFLAEEPTDFGVSTVGSRGMVGALGAEAPARRDADGRTLGACIASVGGRPEALARPLRGPGSIELYLELHIEQGPVLEQEGLRLGVVTAITGICRFRVEIEGRPDHAGTMPMDRRRDALAAAAETVLALEAIWQDGSGVGTVGRLSLSPNATNVVPGSVELWAEMRSVDRERLELNRRAFPEQIHEIAARRGVVARIEAVSAEEPVLIPERVQDTFAAVLGELGQAPRRLPSYAGHDGNQMAKIAPIGMLFVPSRDGRSHCPEEWTELADVALGVQALGQALLRFDAELGA